MATFEVTYFETPKNFLEVESRLVTVYVDADSKKQAQGIIGFGKKFLSIKEVK